jgi:3-hydroxy-3-methylglutaryl CoA synthase
MNLRGSDAFEKQELEQTVKLFPDHWKKKCAASSLISQRTGNIYTGSLYLNLVSFLINSQDIRPVGFGG